MESNNESPLFGVVSRLYDQKGLDLLIELLPQLMAESHANFAILGSGIPMKNKPFVNYLHHFLIESDALLALMTAWLEGFLQDLIFSSCPVALNHVDSLNSTLCDTGLCP